MSGEEIVSVSREYTLYEWSAQNAVDPIPVERAEGVYFYSPDGTRYLDFNSQLMSVNIGHGDRRVIRAIKEQAEKLAYANPFMATEPRARLGEKLASIAPGDIDVFFFTNGGAEANENAIKLARQMTGRQKILARYRSYHGATGQVITATGDPRRWAAETGVWGVVRLPDFQPWGVAEPLPTDQVLRATEDVIIYEGPQTIAAMILEPVVGTNGILIPPDGYMQGIRALCDKYGILLIADEVMTRLRPNGRLVGGRPLGRRPRPDLDGQGLDLLIPAAGCGGHAALDRRGVPRQDLLRRPDLQLAPDGQRRGPWPRSPCTRRTGSSSAPSRWAPSWRGTTRRLMEKHPSVGSVRNIGLFGMIDVVRSRSPYEPMAPYNGTSDEMKAIAKFCRDNGLYTMYRWNGIHTNPPLIITEEQLAEGFEIIDRALDISDQAVR